MSLCSAAGSAACCSPSLDCLTAHTIACHTHKTDAHTCEYTNLMKTRVQNTNTQVEMVRDSFLACMGLSFIPLPSTLPSMLSCPGWPWPQTCTSCQHRVPPACDANLQMIITGCLPASVMSTRREDHDHALVSRNRFPNLTYSRLSGTAGIGSYRWFQSVASRRCNVMEAAGLSGACPQETSSRGPAYCCARSALLSQAASSA